MNETGRRRRSEAREAMQSLMQYLIFEEFQIESRRCARVDADGDLVAPDLQLVARQLSASSTDWHGAPLSYWRVLRILRQFEKVGYIKRTEQYRYQDAHGGWCASTRAITFTKLFFLELGGQSLWNQVLEAGREKTRAAAVRFAAAGRNARDAVAGLFRFTRIFSPWMTKSKPPPSTN